MKAVKLAIAAFALIFSTQSNAQVVTVDFTGTISTIYDGTTDSRLGIGLNDTFSASIVIDTADFCCTGTTTPENDVWHAYTGGTSASHLNFNGSSVDSANAGDTVHNDYALTTAEVTWLAANKPDIHANVGDLVDYFGVGGGTNDGYEFGIDWFFLSNVLNDNGIPDFSQINPNDSAAAIVWITDQQGGTTLFDADGLLTSLSYHVSEVPAPAAVWLFGLGLLGLGVVARRRQAA